MARRCATRHDRGWNFLLSQPAEVAEPAEIAFAPHPHQVVVLSELSASIAALSFAANVVGEHIRGKSRSAALGLCLGHTQRPL